MIVDLFSRWVEAFPLRNCTADATTKIMLNEVFPRWGLPLQIDSDQGTHFTGKVMKNVMKLMGVRQHFHIPFRPQSSRSIERTNRTLKTSLRKRLLEWGKGWHAAVPAILLGMRASPNKTTQLSPFEVMTGRYMRLPWDAPLQHEGPSRPLKDTLQNYLKALDDSLRDTRVSVSTRQADRDNVEQKDMPALPEIGDNVMLQREIVSPLGPKFDGPYQVVLTTNTSVLLDRGVLGTVWRHWSQMAESDNILKLLILQEEVRSERRLKVKRAFIRLVLLLSLVFLILIALSFLMWIQISIWTGRFHAFSTHWDCEEIDNHPSWVQYPCLNSTEGLNLIPTMYQKVNDSCYRLDGNETVTYWLGHSPNYPDTTLIMQKGRWMRSGGVDLFEGDFSSMSWIPDHIAHENMSACSIRMDMVN
ncbi:uncharacterized protein LOC127653809 [Xyrauchen texanus]|uniref:uncharacterized protein LOC127653809 n=1 Tax=Xyrauchen texanus TaxID=154827 RepID=UPI002241CA20|nr:uncharacterized protein LOC127653809 [Xyrauchen texanus]